MVRTARATAPQLARRNGILRRALGDLCTDESCMMTGPMPSFPASTGTPGDSGTPWWQTAIMQAEQIALPLIRQQTQRAPYFVTSPTGQSVLYNPNSGMVSTGANVASAINPQYLVWGLGGILAIGLIGALKSK